MARWHVRGTITWSLAILLPLTWIDAGGAETSTGPARVAGSAVTKEQPKSVAEPLVPGAVGARRTEPVVPPVRRVRPPTPVIPAEAKAAERRATRAAKATKAAKVAPAKAAEAGTVTAKDETPAKRRTLRCVRGRIPDAEGRRCVLKNKAEKAETRPLEAKPGGPAPAQKSTPDTKKLSSKAKSAAKSQR